MAPRIRFRDTYQTVKDYVLAHAIQLYIGGMFTLMAALRFVETNDIPGGLWWALVYALVAHVIGAGLVWSGSRTLAAATGALIIIVSSARMWVIGQRAYEILWTSPEDAARAAVAILLWGLVLVVGTRWPRFAFESEVRELLNESEGSSSWYKAEPHGVV